MTTIRTAGALALALAIGACSDAPTTAPTNSTSTLTPAPATMARAATPAPSASLTNAVLTSLGSVVGSFTGTATLQSVTTSGGQLLGNILLVGTAVVNGVTTTVNKVVTVPLTASNCPVLLLDVGAIHLNLLGLDVALAPIHLDITAVPGPGNLLGNLLCTVTHLLDSPGVGGGLSNAIANLLSTINGLLSGL